MKYSESMQVAFAVKAVLENAIHYSSSGVVRVLNDMTIEAYQNGREQGLSFIFNHRFVMNRSETVFKVARDRGSDKIVVYVDYNNLRAVTGGEEYGYFENSYEAVKYIIVKIEEVLTALRELQLQG